jgi:hypothetical protein
MSHRNVKELFFENKVRDHQSRVKHNMNGAIAELIHRADKHDNSKLSGIEKRTYVEPVWELETGNVKFGSKEYDRIQAKKGEGWKHHVKVNDHHPEHFKAFKNNNLFALLEMLADWKAAAEYDGNAPEEGFKHIKKRMKLSGELEGVLRNTLKIMAENNDVTPAGLLAKKLQRERPALKKKKALTALLKELEGSKKR